MKSFNESSYLAKVRRLRAITENALNKYSIKVKSIQFLKYAPNAIFKITDSRKKQYVFRIHPPAKHTKGAIQEEIKWMNHLLNNTNIIVPKPIPTSERKYVIEEKHSTMESSRFCDMFEWLPGKTMWKGIDEKYAYNLGSLIGQLQKDGKKITIKHRDYWNLDSLIGTATAKFSNVEKLSNVTKKEQQIIKEARRAAYKKIKYFCKHNKNKTGLIHGDMQPNNILVNNNNYAVIDFDDCGLGLYGDDLASALFSFEYVVESSKDKNFHALKESLFSGYSDYMPFSKKDIEMNPYFLLARKLFTVGWMEYYKKNEKIKPYFRVELKRTINYYKKLLKNEV